MELDLRLLKSFVAVAEERNFGRAASRLCIAQPPLSQQIRKLEAQLGVEVIDRSTRPVSLTPAGCALLGEARLALAHAERGALAAKRAGEGQLGYLSIGAMQSAISEVVPTVVRAYRARFPDVGVSIAEESSLVQVVGLLESRLDVGFVRGLVIDDPALVVEPILDDSLAAVLPSGHPLAHQQLVEPAEIVKYRLVLPTRSSAPTTYADVVLLLQRLGAELHNVEETNTVQACLALVAAGLGLSLLPISFSHLGRVGVTFRPLAPPIPERPLAVAWRAGSRSPTLDTFLSVIREVIANKQLVALPADRSPTLITS